MTEFEKIVFIEDLCNAMRRDLTGEAPKMPADWDGYELRQLLGDYVNEQINYMPMNRKRLKDYKNTRLIKNI